jgi:hypothetical protein
LAPDGRSGAARRATEGPDFRQTPGADVMILKIFSPKNLAKKFAFLTKLNFEKYLIITLVFRKNAIFFRRKLGKIAENCDHNIDPWCLSYQKLQIVTLQSIKSGRTSFLKSS